MSTRTRNYVLIAVVIFVVLGLLIWLALTNTAFEALLGINSTASSTAATSTDMMASSSMPTAHGSRSTETGSIQTLSPNGFTITLTGGATKDINLSATTTIHNYTSTTATPTVITADQLSVGENVMVMGTSDNGGSIDAATVEVGSFPAPTHGAGGKTKKGKSATPAQ